MDRTWWSASSGRAGEWLLIDLQAVCQIKALQLSFADQNSTQLGRPAPGAFV